MLAIAPVTDAAIHIWQGCHTEMALKRTTVYLFPRVLSGDPTFASRPRRSSGP